MSKVNVCVRACVPRRPCAGLHFEARRVFCVETPHAARARRSRAPAAAACSAAGGFPLEQSQECGEAVRQLIRSVALPSLIQQFVIKEKKKKITSDSWQRHSSEIKQCLMW